MGSAKTSFGFNNSRLDSSSTARIPARRRSGAGLSGRRWDRRESINEQDRLIGTRGRGPRLPLPRNLASPRAEGKHADRARAITCVISYSRTQTHPALPLIGDSIGGLPGGQRLRRTVGDSPTVMEVQGGKFN
jgi:hypothetical protein